MDSVQTKRDPDTGLVTQVVKLTEADRLAASNPVPVPAFSGHVPTIQQALDAATTPAVTSGGASSPPASPSASETPPAGGDTDGQADAPEGEKPNATDSAVERAAQLNIELSSVAGTGKDGRVLLTDVEAAAAAGQAPAGGDAGTTPPAGDGAGA